MSIHYFVRRLGLLVGILSSLSACAAGEIGGPSGDPRFGSVDGGADPFGPAPVPGEGWWTQVTKPTAANTGPSNRSVLSAANVPPGTITTNGATYENFSATGTIVIDADNVTLRNFKIDQRYNYYGIQIKNGHSGILIEDGEIYNIQSAGLMGVGFTARRLYIHESNSDAMKIQGSGGPTLVEYSYIEKVGKAADSHPDGNQTQGGSNITFRYNNIHMPSPGTSSYPGAPYKANATFMLQRSISNLVIENNWMNGGSYTIYCPGESPDGVVVRNNVFGRDFTYGTRSGPCSQWYGNIWQDTGGTVN